MSKEGHSFEKLLHIITILRSEKGCPWDLKQTPDTVKRFIIEEAYEAVDAVETNNNQGVKEELGDLLFMTLFMAKLFDEKDIFSVEDVLETVSSKMVYRHPHVFGNLELNSAEEVEENWKQLKQIEKASNDKNLLSESDLPRCLPALMRANRFISRVSKNKYKNSTLKQLVGALIMKLQYLERDGEKLDINQRRLRIGDILLELVAAARLMSVDSEDALQERLRESMRMLSNH